MKKNTETLLIFVNPEFDQRIPCGISRIYRIFSKKYKYNIEIINEEFLKTNKPDKNGPQVLVVAGGDGTFHYMLNLIPENVIENYIFGVIPAGTANEFAKSLNLPILLEEAAEVIAQKRRIITQKPGIINKKYKFVTGFLYGIACKVLLETPPRAKHFLGNYAYQLPGLFSFSDYQIFVKKFAFDSQEFSTGYLLINCASLASKGVFPDELKNEDKKLFSIVYIGPELKFGDFLRLVIENQTGENILHDESIFYRQINDFKLCFDGEIKFMLDGEVYSMVSPIEFEHCEQCIKVIV